MNISCSDLKTERQWRAAIGMNEARFIQRLKVFKTCYISYYGNTLNSQLIKSARDYCINNEEELLLFTLFSLKSGLTYDLLGFVAGMGSDLEELKVVSINEFSNHFIMDFF